MNKELRRSGTVPLASNQMGIFSAKAQGCKGAKEAANRKTGSESLRPCSAISKKSALLAKF